jgi:hypothetical protein
LIASDGQRDSRKYPGVQAPDDAAAVLISDSIEGKKIEAFSRKEYQELVRAALIKAVPKDDKRDA